MSPATLRRERVGAGPPAAHPRVAARRAAVTRRRSRPRLVLLVVLAVVTIAGGLAWPLLHSRFLSARVLRVEGNAHTTTAAILAAAGLASHPPMIDVSASKAAGAVDALPWVATASVRLSWPDAVVVRVTERRAVAVAAEGSRWAVLDPTGRVLAVEPSAPPGLAKLVSVAPPGSPGTTVSAPARDCLSVAARVPVALASMLTAVSPSPAGGVDLALDDGVGVVLGSPTDLLAKFEDVASILAAERLPAGSVIDVSVPQSPAVTPPAAPVSHSSSAGSPAA